MKHSESTRERRPGKVALPVPVAWLVLLGMVAIAWWVALANGRGVPLAAWERFRESRANGLVYDWKQAVALGTWMAVVTTVTVLVALVTMRWWLGGGMVPGDGVRSAGSSRTFRLLVLGAVLAALLLRLPLARGSLWWDELWNVRYATLGEWRESGGGGMEFREWPWSRAFWYYGKPTNHAVQTVPSKLAERGWRLLRGEPAGEVHEVALRFPVLASGLGALWGGRAVVRDDDADCSAAAAGGVGVVAGSGWRSVALVAAAGAGDVSADVVACAGACGHLSGAFRGWAGGDLAGQWGRGGEEAADGAAGGRGGAGGVCVSRVVSAVSAAGGLLAWTQCGWESADVGLCEPDGGSGGFRRRAGWARGSAAVSAAWAGGTAGAMVDGSAGARAWSGHCGGGLPADGGDCAGWRVLLSSVCGGPWSGAGVRSCGC
jgi:hypothetical protein